MAGIFTPLAGDGASSPWRTRGSFDPTAPANAAAANLPVQSDVVIGPYLNVAPGDAFIVTRPFSYAALSNGAFDAVPGDRVVYVGGTITLAASWLFVPEAYKYGAGARLAVISQLDPAFLM
jgi:hypothetical protein